MYFSEEGHVQNSRADSAGGFFPNAPGRRGFGRNLLAGTILAAIYGYIDEHTQRWFMRVFSFADVTANMVGVVFTFLVLYVGQCAPEATVSRLRLARAVVAFCGVVVAWSLAAAAWPNVWPLSGAAILLSGGPVARVLGAMALTWLLAAARPAGRSAAGGVNVFVCTSVVAVLGVAIQAAQLLGAPDADVVAMLWHQLGLLLGLSGWALLVLVRHAHRPQPLRWPPLFAACPQVAPRVAGKSGQRFVGHAVLVGAMTLVSRVTGLLRDTVLVAVFGMAAITDAFIL